MDGAVQTRPAHKRNAVIFAAGCTFFALSLLVTRRAFTRRRLAAVAAASGARDGSQGPKVHGALEAFEALNVATINVLSLAMAGAGGALWYFDIQDMADARRKMQRGIGFGGGDNGNGEKEAAEEFEEWMATVLARKEAKDQARSHANDK